MKKKHKFISFILAIIIGIPFFTACDKKSPENSDNSEATKLSIAVTILPQQTFVKEVCGDLVNITTLVPAGASPESYEPTTKQLEDFSNADIYFKIGVPVEDSKMIPEAKDMIIIDLSKKVSSVYSDRFFDGESRDPHIWLSPKRAIVMVDTIADELSKIDTENATVYKANAAAYINKLSELDSYVSGLFINTEENKNIFLTFHPAYGYFADDYGLSMYALEQEGRGATMQDLMDMIDFAKEHGIKVLFSQAESDSNQPQTFVNEVDGEVIINPLSDDYISNIKFMAEKISGALG